MTARYPSGRFQLKFSAAQGFTEFCKGSGWATVVGEYTRRRQRRVHPAMVTLPNSKMPIFAAGMGRPRTSPGVEKRHSAVTDWANPDIIRLVSDVHRTGIH